MKKLAITTFVIGLAFTSVAQAATAPAPHKGKVHKHHGYSRVKPVAKPNTAQYSDLRIGDPRIVYHQIGTSGAQTGNTIIPFAGEPLRSNRPYEIRYDYNEF